MSASQAKSIDRNTLEFLPVCTLVLWSFCLAIGVAGFALRYERPHPPVKEPEPIQAEVLKVELTSDPLPPLPDTEPPPNLAQPPPLLEKISTPQTPPMVAVASPSPAIAFALPVEGPTRIVEKENASYAQPAESLVNAVMASSRPPQPLTFGRGEGKQPAPDYPSQARRQGQEGTVTVRFSVGENGRVLEADAISPSPWPMLNQAALRVIRERWRFRPGIVRLYEVSIRFELQK
jgi:protein TonB